MSPVERVPLWRIPLGFMTELLRQPAWVPIWVTFLMGLNLAALLFRGEPLAQWILGVFLVSAGLMMGLYARFGFQKILGLGHILWLPLLPVVLMAIPAAEGAFRSFLMVWSSATAVSLAFDIRDVWSHFGQRKRDPGTPTHPPTGSGDGGAGIREKTPQS
ncbi:MAG: hypothetical protein WEA09_01305 [Gemmatimonadota bacterium]